VNSRDDLITAATRVFAEKGYSATSLRDIATAAGIQRGSVYHHVASKEELLLQGLLPALEQATIEVESVVNDALAQPAPDFAQALRTAIATHLHCLYGNASLEGVKIYLAENLLASHSELTPAAKSRLRSMTSRHQANLTRLLQAGISAGTFRPGLDAKLEAYLVLGMCNWVSRWYRADGVWSLDQISEAITDMVVLGLAAGVEAARL
jgi:TetR/AcrR family transcriptional regulator, cholesterol catabolism regulator